MLFIDKDGHLAKTFQKEKQKLRNCV